MGLNLPVGVLCFKRLAACAAVAVKCGRKICVLHGSSGLCHASGFFLHKCLHGFSELALLGQHVTHHFAHTLRLTHVVCYLHGCVFLLRPLRLSGSNKKYMMLNIDVQEYVRILIGQN